MTDLLALGAAALTLASTAEPPPWEFFRWEPVPQRVTAAAVADLVLTGTAAGLAVALDGAVLATADGGRTWGSRTRLGGPARRIAAVRSRLAVAGDGRVWVSDDGGSTFAERRLATDAAINALVALPDGSFLAAGMWGFVGESRDGGAAWRPVGRRDLGHLFTVGRSPDGVTLAGGFAGLWRSVGGGPWAAVPLPVEGIIGSKPRVNDLAFGADGSVWIVGTLGELAAIWHAGSARAAPELVHVDEDVRYLRLLGDGGGELWACGDPSLVAVSPDGGRIWHREPLPEGGTWRALARGPGGTMWAAGDRGRIYRGTRPPSRR